MLTVTKDTRLTKQCDVNNERASRVQANKIWQPPMNEEVNDGKTLSQCIHHQRQVHKYKNGLIAQLSQLDMENCIPFFLLRLLTFFFGQKSVITNRFYTNHILERIIFYLYSIKLKLLIIINLLFLFRVFIQLWIIQSYKASAVIRFFSSLRLFLTIIFCISNIREHKVKSAQAIHVLNISQKKMILAQCNLRHFNIFHEFI